MVQPARSRTRTSAGVLLYRVDDDRGVEVLLVHMGGPYWQRKDAGAWSIPKGEHGPDEPAREVASREFEEELGSPLPSSTQPDLDLGSVKQAGGKVVSVFARAVTDFDVSTVRSNTFDLEWPPRSGRVQAFPEVDRAAWFDLPTAVAKVVAAQRAFLDRLSGALADPTGRAAR